MNIVYQFINQGECLRWKSDNRKDLIGKRADNCKEIVFHGYADECPSELLQDITFRGNDSYLLILNIPIQPNQSFISPLVAKRLLEVRDALILNEIDDAYHQLYLIACPNLDKSSEEVFRAMEALAAECKVEI